MQMETINKNKIDFRKISRFEPTWLYNLRKNGWDYYHNAPLPDRVGHLWRYSDPQMFLIDKPEQAMNILPVITTGGKTESLPEDFNLDALGSNGDDLSMVLQTSLKADKSGLILRDLLTAAGDYPELVEKYLGKLVTIDFGIFEALNMALWNTGIFLYIPDNAVIEKPIYLNRRSTGDKTITRLLIVMGQNSEATIIDDYKGPYLSDKAIVNSAVEIFAGDSARVHYINLQQLGQGSNSFITQRTQLGSDAESYSIFISLGGAKSKINAGTILNGRGAISNMYGIAFGDKNQKFDHHTSQIHEASNSYSNIDFKIVLKDKAISAYTGLIKIAKDTVNCEAFQENRNMLLDKGTKAESIPELEILTDQVKCSHGATVGPIDPQMIFYLKSRGYNTEEAIKALVMGFMESTLHKMPEDMERSAREAISRKLEGK
jgi:Fe-S cluster assembly protein SufD